MHHLLNYLIIIHGISYTKKHAFDHILGGVRGIGIV